MFPFTGEDVPINLLITIKVYSLLLAAAQPTYQLASHSRFHDYITYQSRGRVFKVNEKYTTKTCAKCHERTDIGASKIFECEKCNYKADRDVNTAISILVKNMVGDANAHPWDSNPGGRRA